MRTQRAQIRASLWSAAACRRFPFGARNQRRSQTQIAAPYTEPKQLHPCGLTARAGQILKRQTQIKMNALNSLNPLTRRGFLKTAALATVTIAAAAPAFAETRTRYKLIGFTKPFQDLAPEQCADTVA